MLLELAQLLAQEVRAFNVFNYITLRAVLATLTALVISFIVGPAMIRKLDRLQDRPGGARRRSADPSHQGRHADHGRRADPGLDRRHHPAVGGSVATAASGWCCVVTLGFGMVGWVDDYRKVVHRNPKGLSARAKYFWQSVIGLAAAAYLAFSATLPAQTEFIVPFFKQVAYPLGVVGFIGMTYFVIVGTSNAVNLTDGLDGLAIMPTVMVGSALGVFAYVAGHAVFSKYLGFPHIPGAGELTVICGAIAGAGLAFLWFNAYPAEVFMGDVGALALGAALGTIAVICRQEIVLFIMGGVFVVETLSVMLQVGLVQADRQAHLPHGAAAPPLRAEGLERKPSGGPLLDHHDDAGPRRALNTQTQMRKTADHLISVEANSPGKLSRRSARRPEPKPGRCPLLDHNDDAGAGWIVEAETAMNHEDRKDAKAQSRRKERRASCVRVSEVRWTAGCSLAFPLRVCVFTVVGLS